MHGKRTFLAVFLLLACLMALLPAFAREESPEAEKLVSALTLHEKVCQMIVVTPEFFSGTERVLIPDERLEDTFMAFPAGGVLITGRNIATGEQVAALNKAYASLTTAPFVIVNEESAAAGTVSLKLSAEPLSGEITEPAEGWYAWAAKTASELKQMNFTMDLAPVADLGLSALNEEMAGRCISDREGTVAAAAAQMIQGYTSGGIISAVKHFPGCGRADSPVSLTEVRIGAAGKKLYASDIMPFRMAVAAGVPCVMVSGAVYEALDPDHPACFSPEIMQKLLRGELGFNGVIMTSVLDSPAFTDRYSAKEIVLAAVGAGADMLLLPPKAQKAAEYLEAAVLSGEISEERINESVERILKLKLEYGLLERPER